MNYRLIIRPEAEADLESAKNWYEERKSGLGAKFLAAVEEGLEALVVRPMSFVRVHRGVRRAIAKPFPYGLYFVVRGDIVSVIAVVHLARHARIWRRRPQH